MSGITIFDGRQDVLTWSIQLKAHLKAKGFKNQLLDNTRPAQAGDAQTRWDELADKAVGTILMHIDASISEAYDQQTPQPLLAAITAHYAATNEQMARRHEGKWELLTYDGTDPIKWSAEVKTLIAKLAHVKIMSINAHVCCSTHIHIHTHLPSTQTQQKCKYKQIIINVIRGSRSLDKQ